MKKIHILFVIAALVCAGTTVNAKSWRVNSLEKAKADFLSVAEAIASEEVTDGDELYLEPGHVEQNDLTITKKLHLIGPGYWNEQASSNVSYSSSAVMNGRVLFDKTANGSSITGCILNNGTGNNSSNTNYADNITISRCLSLTNMFATSCSSWNIINCYINGSVAVGLSSNIIGCIICGDFYYQFQMGAGSVVSNNTIIGDHTTGYDLINNSNIKKCSFINNIVYNTNTKGKTVSITANNGINATNNIFCQSEAISDFPYNIYNPYTLADIFKMTGNEAEKYELKEDSPAKGYGTNGTDCGAYGGEHPFVKSGYPQFVPVIYDVKVAGAPTEGKLPVQLKIRTQND